MLILFYKRSMSDNWSHTPRMVSTTAKRIGKAITYAFRQKGITYKKTIDINL